MPDWFLIFAPVLLIPIVALLRFVGCQLVFPLDPTISQVDVVAVNCGGPQESDGNLVFEKDDNPQGTTAGYFESQGGEPVKVTAAQVLDQNGNPASIVYGTGRKGDSFKYTFIGLIEGGYVVTLRFAEIAGVQNAGGRVFAIGVNAAPDAGHPFDIVARAGGPLKSFDLEIPAQPDD